MIRINLLPVREIKRKEAIKRAVAIYFISVAAALVLMGLVYVTTTSRLAQKEKEKEALTVEEADLKKKVAAVEQLKKEESDLNDKLKIVMDLETKRRGPVKILEEVSRRIPRDRVYLSELTQTGERLTIGGDALDNESIVLFMASLDPTADDVAVTPASGPAGDVSKPPDGTTPAAAPKGIFRNVELVSTQQTLKASLALKTFIINCVVVLDETPKANEAGKGPAGKPDTKTQ